MKQTVSKSQFKAQALEYLREVEKERKPLTITHEGKPVVQVIPYAQKDPLAELRGTLVFYKDPDKPVGEDDWEALR